MLGVIVEINVHVKILMQRKQATVHSTVLPLYEYFTNRVHLHE
jgi:hypothetical protein